MDYTHLTIFSLFTVLKSLVRKKSKDDEQTLAEVNSAHRGSQAKYLLKPVTLNELNCSCLRHN